MRDNVLMVVRDAEGYHLSVGSCVEKPCMCLCSCGGHTTVDGATRCGEALDHVARLECGPVESPLPIVDRE